MAASDPYRPRSILHPRRARIIIATGSVSFSPTWQEPDRPALMLDMRVIFVDISAGRVGLSSSEMEARGCRCRSVSDPVVGRGRGAGVRLGVPLLDAYLEFVAARCRPNTVLAVAYRPEGVLRGGRQAAGGGRAGGRARRSSPRSGTGAARDRLVALVDGGRWGVGADGAAAAVERVGAVRVPAGPRRRGASTRCRGACRPGGSGSGPRQGVPLVRAARTLPRILSPGRGRRADRRVAHAPGPGDGRGDGAGRAAPLRGPRAAAGGSAVRRAAGVHRRGQGRAPAAGPGLGPVLHRGRRLSRRRAAGRTPAPTGCSWC